MCRRWAEVHQDGDVLTESGSLTDHFPTGTGSVDPTDCWMLNVPAIPTRCTGGYGTLEICEFISEPQSCPLSDDPEPQDCPAMECHTIVIGNPPPNEIPPGVSHTSGPHGFQCYHPIRILH